MEREIKLNQQEQYIAKILTALSSGKMTYREAGIKLGLSKRQLQRKKAALLKDGVASIPHKLKNVPSGRGYGNDFKNKIIALYQEEYPGWNFTHFGDALEDDYNIFISDSFIYKALTSAGIKSPKTKRHKPKAHPPRSRRENAGELVQIDASDHLWIELGGVKHHLHGAIDDATGIVLSCVLQKEETIYGYQLMLKEIIENYGISECLYTDYRTVFQSPKKLTPEEELIGKEIEATRFTKMANRLGIDILSTMRPQAKGRIERLWGAFQDRLVKELKKNHITNLDEANKYIKEVFLPRYNARFASAIDYNKNLFVKVSKDFDYNKELALLAHRRVCHHSYIVSEGKTYAIFKQNSEVAWLGTRESVEVYIFLDKTRRVFYNDEWYDLQTIKRVKVPKPTQKKPRLTRDELYKMRSEFGKKGAANSPWGRYVPCDNFKRG